MAGRLTKHFPILLVCLFHTSCDSRKSAVKEIVFDYYEDNYGFVDAVGFSKINGVKGEISGYEVYEIEYAVTLELTEPVMMDNNFGAFRCSNLIPWDSWVGAGLGYMRSAKGEYKAGHRFQETGKLLLRKTESGWKRFIP